jgi:glycerol kinase
VKYYLSIDSGTTSIRSILFNEDFSIVSIAQEEIPLIYSNDGWVEQDANLIIELQRRTIEDVIKNSTIGIPDIIACGITNQRETTILWNRKTGKPIYNAIVWQDRRTAKYSNILKKDCFEFIRKKTGLIPDPYFSATKIKWIYENVIVKNNIPINDIIFGTIDTWLIYNLLEGNPHYTDYSNASRTMIFNIKDLRWDNELLSIFNIPESILPDVMDSNANFGNLIIMGEKIPVKAVLGDQQSALYGHSAFNPGDTKITYGTGAFILINIGERLLFSNNNLLSTIAWCKDGVITYAMEGSVFIAGAVIQWLRDNLNFFNSSKDSELAAIKANEKSDVYFVPAFVGLGAPYWRPDVRGAIVGLTRDTGIPEITRAALEGVAFLVNDLIESVCNDLNIIEEKLFVDGGMSNNDCFLQLQSDISNMLVERPVNTEMTSLGVALLAAGVGDYKAEVDRIFKPEINLEIRDNKIKRWKDLIRQLIKEG